MLAERAEVMNGLEALCSILANVGLPISDEDRKSKLAQIEQSKAIVKNKKYHVTALGIFSTGKSTLINSMIGEDYLPAADHPTTARITEIRPSEKAFVILHTEETPTEKELDTARKFLSKLGYNTGKNGNIQIQSKMILEPTDSDREVVKGVVITGTTSHAIGAPDVHYAYPGKSGQVLVECDKSDKLVFTITDSGVPFDPTQQEDPDMTQSAEERPIGGLGIFLVRQIMDDIRYERKDDKNILTLTKKL